MIVSTRKDLQEFGGLKVLESFTTSWKFYEVVQDGGRETSWFDQKIEDKRNM